MSLELNADTLLMKETIIKNISILQQNFFKKTLKVGIKETRTFTMSTKVKLWNRYSALPSVVALFAIAVLAQLPHYYYLSEIMKLNQEDYIVLLISFPIFGAIGLTAVALLLSDYLLNRLREPSEKLVPTYVLRGGLFAAVLYFIVQIFIVFFGFEAITEIREAMPEELINNVALKEVIGMGLLLIIAFFLNPPIDARFRTKKI